MEWLVEAIAEGVLQSIAELFKPKVKLTVAHKAFLERDNVDTGNREVWAQLQLSTPSKRMCKGCVVWLIKIEKLNADGTVSNDDFVKNHIPLRWSGAKSIYEADIDRDDPQLLDFFRLRDRDIVLPQDGAAPLVIENAGKYKYYLQVKSKNARDHFAKIEVESQGLRTPPGLSVVS